MKHTFEQNILDSHSNQKRNSGEAYSFHLKRVQLKTIETIELMKLEGRFQGTHVPHFKESLKYIAIAHDYLKDQIHTCGSAHMLQDLLRVDLPHLHQKDQIDFIHSSIAILTKSEKETYFDYIARLLREERHASMFVKLADLYDNTRDIKEGARKDKYRFAAHLIGEFLLKEYKGSRVLQVLVESITK